MLALLENTSFMKIVVTSLIALLPLLYRYIGIGDTVTLAVVGSIAASFGIYAMSNVATQKIDAAAVLNAPPVREQAKLGT